MNWFFISSRSYNGKINSTIILVQVLCRFNYMLIILVNITNLREKNVNTKCRICHIRLFHSLATNKKTRKAACSYLYCHLFVYSYFFLFFFSFFFFWLFVFFELFSFWVFFPVPRCVSSVKKLFEKKKKKLTNFCFW